MDKSTMRSNLDKVVVTTKEMGKFCEICFGTSEIVSAVLAELNIDGGDGWHPIQVAPKDGTPILIAIESVHNPNAAAIARWVPAEEKWVTDGNRRVSPISWHPIPRRSGWKRRMEDEPKKAVESAND